MHAKLHGHHTNKLQKDNDIYGAWGCAKALTENLNTNLTPRLQNHFIYK